MARRHVLPLLKYPSSLNKNNDLLPTAIKCQLIDTHISEIFLGTASLAFSFVDMIIDCTTLYSKTERTDNLYFGKIET